MRSQQNIGVSVQSGANGWPESANLDTDDGPQENTSWQQVGKSAWVGRDGEVTVEGWVLEWWEDRAFEG